MKISVAQLNFHIGNFEANLKKIADAVITAKEQGGEMVIFPELAVCGYPPRDFLEFGDFIERCGNLIQEICQLSEEHQIAIITGCPRKNPVLEGKDLYNSAYFINKGKIISIANKTLLPTYDIFDEYRYFEPGADFEVIEFGNHRIALTICEDLWNIGNENPLYTICPMDILIEDRPDLMINISASPFDYEHANERINILKANCDQYGLPVIYVNHTGAQTEIIFDGGSLIMNDAGKVVDELPYFTEIVKTFETEKLYQTNNPVAKDHIQIKEVNTLIYNGLIEGVRNYFGKLGFKKAILGLSGGIDSALVMVLAVEALGAENVKAVLMPSQYSSGHSTEDALKLCANLGVQGDIIPIDTVYQSHLKQLEPYFEKRPFGVAEENLQARVRAAYLMALSNKLGYILLNTSNKSEGAVGYSTLYGDMAGGLSVIGDIYKTQVYDLCKWINSRNGIIPQHIIDKPPSAELRPDQKDSDSLPEYNILDPILYQYIEKRKGPNEIKQMGFDSKTVDRILKLVNQSEFKRYQTPPILRVSTKAFGMGRRMPIVAKYLS